MQSASLARAKIQTPRFRSGLIERSEFEQQLGDALANRRLVLLVAPAGYGKTAAQPRASAAQQDAGLSQRELEVLALLTEGQSNKLIARALDLSPHTVKRHVARILDRLDLASRVQAADWYRTRFGS